MGDSYVVMLLIAFEQYNYFNVQTIHNYLIIITYLFFNCVHS